MILQRKKASSFVPAIFCPIAWPFRKKGGTGTGIRFSLPWVEVPKDIQADIHTCIFTCRTAATLATSGPS